MFFIIRTIVERNIQTLHHFAKSSTMYMNSISQYKQLCIRKPVKTEYNYPSGPIPQTRIRSKHIQTKKIPVPISICIIIRMFFSRLINLTRLPWLI